MRDSGSGTWDAGSKSISDKIRQFRYQVRGDATSAMSNVKPFIASNTAQQKSSGNSAEDESAAQKAQLYIVNSASSFLYAVLNDLKIFGDLDFSIVRVDNLDTLNPAGQSDVIVVDGSVDSETALWELHRACALAPEVPVIFLHESNRDDMTANAAICGAIDSIHMQDLTASRLEDAIKASLGSAVFSMSESDADEAAFDGTDYMEQDMHSMYYSWLRDTLDDLDTVHANAVLARTAQLSGESAESPVVQERMDHVIHSTDRMRRSIQEMIWVFQAASTTPEATFSRMDVRHVLDEAMKIAVERTEVSPEIVNYVRPVMPIRVDVDSNQLFDGLSELIERALKGYEANDILSLRLALGQGCFEIGLETSRQLDLSGTVLHSVAESHNGTVDVFSSDESWHVFFVAPLRQSSDIEDASF